MLQDGQAEAIGAIAEVDDAHFGPLRFANLPFFLEGRKGRVQARAPRLGEHTRAVLADLGYDEARIQALIDEGAVRGE
ncbi:MAG: CoA transferase, partial [Gammaproteobacteria bacterium]|nr:CoA transferase [Gammaproteobacteria bacterium]